MDYKTNLPALAQRQSNFSPRDKYAGRILDIGSSVYIIKCMELISQEARMPQKLHFRYGSMNTGKSTELLQVAHNYAEHGLGVLLYTAAADDRYGQGRITSRLGPSRAAAVFDENTDFEQAICAHAGPLHCLLVDEAQFLSPSQAKSLHRVARLHDVAVIAYGLRTDFRGDVFPGSAMLLALAEEIGELKNICRCGKKSTMQLRVDSNGKAMTEGAQVEIGGNDRYTPVCGTCFYRAHDAASTQSR